MKTRAPAPAKVSAIAAPIPEAAPVINAIFCERENIEDQLRGADAAPTTAISKDRTFNIQL
jgi:hypothetical protein